MRLPTQILLLGAILTNGARAQDNAPAAPVPPATDAVRPADPATNSAASAASATIDETVVLEPVRVTADLWETPLEKISASVSVYDGQNLARDGVRHFGDLAAQIPNVTLSGGTSRPRYFQIRGIGENSQFEGETPDSSVRFLVDDLDFTGIGTVGSTFDLRQVEVLRGPQAGSFGANAAGGVVRLVTSDPTPYATGLVEGTVGEDGLREAGVAVGGPVIASDPEKLMFRISAQHHESDGFRRNLFTRSHTNARDEGSLRLKLTWNPSAVWRWDATVFYADVDNGYDEFALDNNGRFTYSDQPGVDVQESLAGSLRGVYSGWRDAVFTTVTTATDTDSRYAYDADWTSWRDVPPVNATDGYQGYEDIARSRQTYGQEFRLDSAPGWDAPGWIDRWTLGVYLARIDENTRYVSDYAENDPVWGSYSERAVMDSEYRSDNLALFGQVAHDFGERSRLILGLRVEDVRQKGVLRTSDTNGNAMTYSPDYHDTLLGGKATFEHDFAPGRRFYASVARGYRGGGINLDRKIAPGIDPLTFETETLWNYEAGLRARWLEDTLIGGVSIFYTDRSNTQFRGSQGNGNRYRYFTDNGGDSAVYGLESDLEYRFAPGWAVYGSLALLGSSFETFDYTSSGAGTERGGRLPNTPDYGFTVGVRYGAARGWFGKIELIARGEYRESMSHDELRSASEVVNASLGYAWERWSVSFWARNLFDEGYEKRVYYFGNLPPAWADTRYVSKADPRQLGVTARYRF